MITQIGLIAACGCGGLFQRLGRRWGGFGYVYVNQDGSARELSPDERDYLQQEFSGADGGRPYVKDLYEARDGWGSLSGFLARGKLPAHIPVQPVRPDYDAAVKRLGQSILDVHRAVGDFIEHRPDGTILCTPNPAVSAQERFARSREHYLAQQRAREELARGE